MSLTRRLLLVATGAGAFFPPQPASFELTAAPYGGWTQANWPSADHYNGVTYFAYVRGDNGNIEVRTYDHGTETVSAPTVLAASFSVDNHAGPSVLVDRVSELVYVAWSDHNDTQLYFAASSNPEDISTFDATQTLNATISGGGGLYTYPTLIQLTGEAGDPVYLFFRRFTGGTTSHLSYTRADSADVPGAFWDTMTTVATRSTFRPYWMLWSDGDTRIDLVITDGAAGEESPVALYSGYYEGGTWQDMDGSTISTPFNPQSLTEVYSQAEDVWSHSVVRVGTDVYTVIATVNSTFDFTEFWYGHWDGASWTVTHIDDTNDVLTGIVLFNDPSTVILNIEVGGQPEIIRYVTADGGATWSSDSVTSSSSNDQRYPVNVNNSSSPVRYIWQNGPWVDPTDYSVGIMAGT